MSKRNWIWIFNSLLQYKKKIIFLIMASLIVSVVNTAFPIIFKNIVDYAVEHGEYNKMSVIIFVVTMIIVALPVVELQGGLLRNMYSYKLRGDTLKQLLRLDISFFDNRGSTIITEQVSKGIEASVRLVNTVSDAQILTQIPIAIFAVIYISRYSLWAVLWLIFFFASFIVAGRILGGKITDAEEQYNEIDNLITHRHREVIQRADVVRVNGAQKEEIDQYWNSGEDALVLRNKLSYLYATFNFLNRVSNSFVNIISIIIFLPMVANGSLTVGTFFALAMYASFVVRPATFFGDKYAMIKSCDAILGPFVDIFSVKPSVKEQDNSLTLNPLKSVLEMKNVTFTYEGADKSSLCNIDLTIPARKVTAIVGGTGSGKSTLARIIMRLYDPEQGTVSFDGTDVRNVSFDSLYKEIVYLSQEVPIFTGTIADNICMGVTDYDEHDVRNALAQVSADFALLQGDGMHVNIGEMGKKLSGGERQRIALARIFMRNPSIIVLDEATSALDNTTEREVVRALNKLSKTGNKKTMIVIAHRLSTVQSADQIVVLDSGKIVDIGTHVELLKRCAIYQKLNKQQEK